MCLYTQGRSQNFSNVSHRSSVASDHLLWGLGLGRLCFHNAEEKVPEPYRLRQKALGKNKTALGNNGFVNSLKCANLFVLQMYGNINPNPLLSFGILAFLIGLATHLSNQ